MRLRLNLSSKPFDPHCVGIKRFIGFKNETDLSASSGIDAFCRDINSDFLFWWNIDKQICAVGNLWGAWQGIILGIILQQKTQSILKSIVSLSLKTSLSPAIFQSNTNVGADPWGSLVHARLLGRWRYRRILQTSDSRAHLQALHIPWGGPVEGKYLYVALSAFASTSNLQETGKSPHRKLRWWTES